jgi:hypothetical protein
MVLRILFETTKKKNEFKKVRNKKKTLFGLLRNRPTD